MNDLLGGRYRLGNALGRGGMGTVYEAVQEGLGRRVAVKLLDERLSDDREQLERFRREAEVVAALGHPNIVQVTDFQYSETKPFLVMELLRGESLGSRIDREGGLTASRIAFIAAQVLSALSVAHRAGIVHRDIKPDNIFLLADAAVPDTVKVLDFGIAKLTTEGQQKLTGTGAMLGTPAFMAPEQARGETDVDARADIYAVGATMYQALTGKLPYDAPSIPALLFAIVEKMPAPLRELRPDLPEDFIAVVERAMAKDRNARFADADEMRDALAPWSGLPTSMRAPISASDSAPTASGGLATAATVASGKIEPYNPPTPAPNPAVTAPSPPPARSGPSALALIALVLVVGMVATAAVFIVAILRKDDTHEHRDKELEHMASARPSTDTSASTSTSTTASTSTSTTASTSATASTMPSASTTVVPTKVKRFGGKDGYVSGGDYSGCPGCDYQGFRNELGMHQAEYTACFRASEHEAPIHENPDYFFAVSADGKLTLQRSQDGAPKLDRCLTRIVLGLKMPMKNATVGSFRMGFRDECTPGWNNHCD